jgi:hypothetical protein
MSKTKDPFPFLSKRDIVLRLTWYEAGDLMQQLNIHKGCLRAEIKRLYETQEERGENCITDIELFTAEEFLDSTRKLKSRLLRIYRRWQKREDKKRAEEYAQEQARRQRGEGDPDEIPF